MLIKDVPINNIILGNNIRQISNKESKINYLMQTIKDNGLLQPIGVRELENDSYKILWGNRRLSACKKLGWKTIPAVIFVAKEEDMTEEEFTVINAIENLQQSPNTLFEMGRICRILRKSMSPSEIAVRLGIPKSRVEAALDEIQRIPEKWQKKIKLMDSGHQDKEGNIPITSAIRVAQMRSIGTENKNKLYEYLSKNDMNLGILEIVGALMKTGMTVEQAIKESNKYIFASVGIYCNKKILDEAMKTYESRLDLIVDAMNKLYPGIAIKKL